MFFHYVARGHGADQIHQENHHHHHDADSLPLYGAVEAAGQCRYKPLWANQITMCTRDLRRPSPSRARFPLVIGSMTTTPTNSFVTSRPWFSMRRPPLNTWRRKKKERNNIKGDRFWPLSHRPQSKHECHLYCVVISRRSIELDSSIIDWLPIVCKSCPLLIYNVRSTFSHWTLEILMFSGPFFSRQMAFFISFACRTHVSICVFTYS